MEFNENFYSRYERQLCIPEIGEEGQLRLGESRVLIIGAGGLGSPVAFYLAAAGVGTLGIADGDTVTLSNLNRQLLHSTDVLGEKKTVSAAASLSALNSEIKINTYDFFLRENNIGEIIKDYDLVVDASDGFANKFLINDACVSANKPFVHGGVLKTGGQIMTVIPHKTPCLRCVFGEMPKEEQTNKVNGILGAVCGIAGSVQAAEAIKFLLGKGELLTGKMLTFDCFTLRFKIISTGTVSDDCPVCAK